MNALCIRQLCCTDSECDWLSINPNSGYSAYASCYQDPERQVTTTLPTTSQMLSEEDLRGHRREYSAVMLTSEPI